MQLNSDLFGALQVISADDELMKKAIKLLKKLAKQKRAADETEYLMSSPAMADVICQGQDDIKNGKGRIVEIDDLWK